MELQDKTLTYLIQERGSDGSLSDSFYFRKLNGYDDEKELNELKEGNGDRLVMELPQRTWELLRCKENTETYRLLLLNERMHNVRDILSKESRAAEHVQETMLSKLEKDELDYHEGPGTMVKPRLTSCPNV